VRAFIDTSAWIALLIKNERDHPAVVRQLDKYVKRSWKLFTSDYILDELYTRFNYDHSAALVKKVQRHMRSVLDSGEVTLLKVDESVFKEAESVITKYSKIKLSFTDCTSFVFFKQLKMQEMFSLDSDFRKLRLVVHP